MIIGADKCVSNESISNEEPPSLDEPEIFLRRPVQGRLEDYFEENPDRFQSIMETETSSSFSDYMPEINFSVQGNLPISSSTSSGSNSSREITENRYSQFCTISRSSLDIRDSREFLG